MEEVNNAYFSIEVDSDSISDIYNNVANFLDGFNISYSKCEKAHITLAYVLGDQKIDFLKDVADEIAEHHFSVKVKGIKFLIGNGTGQNYISLELESDTDFGYAYDFLSENCEVRTYESKTVAHISLFRISKKILKTVNERELFCQVLEMFNVDSLANRTVLGARLAIYNKYREKIMILPIPQR
jgi:hypothetical protein